MDLVKQLISIEEKLKELYKQKSEVVRSIAKSTGCKAPVSFQNPDNTWTRCTITDNLEKIEEGFFNTAKVERFSSKIEVLKNKPKELVEQEAK